MAMGTEGRVTVKPVRDPTAPAASGAEAVASPRARSEISISGELTHRNVEQFFPHADLEISADQNNT
jgi:hypothetical protein